MLGSLSVTFCRICAGKLGIEEPALVLIEVTEFIEVS